MPVSSTVYCNRHENTRILLIAVENLRCPELSTISGKKDLSKLGYLGLQDKEKAKPQMPNQIKPDKENIILNYIIEYPTHGPRRIANELREQDITISEAGIYNVL